MLLEFGLRRRYSGAWQAEVLRTLQAAAPEPAENENVSMAPFAASGRLAAAMPGAGRWGKI